MRVDELVVSCQAANPVRRGLPAAEWDTSIAAAGRAGANRRRSTDKALIPSARYGAQPRSRPPGDRRRYASASASSISLAMSESPLSLESKAESCRVWLSHLKLAKKCRSGHYICWASNYCRLPEWGAPIPRARSKLSG